MATTSQIADYNQRIIATAIKQGAPEVNAKIIAAQAAHETGNFSSNNFIKSNNAFGMAVPRVRKSPYILGAGSVNAPAVEGGFAYAKYASLEDSVKDLIHWLQYNKVVWSDVATPETYAAWLKKKGYYTANQGEYTNAVSKFYNQVKDLVIKNPGSSIAIAVVAGLLIFYGAYLYLNRKKLAGSSR